MMLCIERQWLGGKYKAQYTVFFSYKNAKISWCDYVNPPRDPDLRLPQWLPCSKAPLQLKALIRALRAVEAARREGGGNITWTSVSDTVARSSISSISQLN